MKILYITEGSRDDEPLSAIIERVGSEAVNDRFPVAPDCVDRFLTRRKRGFGGVLDAVRKLSNYINLGQQHPDMVDEVPPVDIVVAVLDNGAPNTTECRNLVNQMDGVFGISVEEFEAWILGDEDSLRFYLGLDEESFREGLGEAYRPELDGDPKATLDTLSELAQGYPWDAVASMLLADQWRDSLNLDTLRFSCPVGFRPFAERLRHRIQAEAGLLQM